MPRINGVYLYAAPLERDHHVPLGDVWQYAQDAFSVMHVCNHMEHERSSRCKNFTSRSGADHTQLLLLSTYTHKARFNDEALEDIGRLRQQVKAKPPHLLRGERQSSSTHLIMPQASLSPTAPVSCHCSPAFGNTHSIQTLEIRWMGYPARLHLKHIQ